MGCGASKNKVHIVGAAPTTKPELKGNQTRVSSKTGARKGRDRAMGSQESLGGISNASDRIGSGTSKVSRRTMDSGFDDNDNVITENSNPNLVKQVEDGFDTPRSLDLGITGQPVQQRYSAKDRERMEEKSVMAKLQEEGLIQRPMSRANFGVSFEVVADQPAMFGAVRPPARLAKLEKRKKKKKPLTQEQIERKLAQAEERRKEREQQRLERIQAVTNKSDVQNALDSFAQAQVAKDEEEQSKQDIAAENRERRLREMRDKLRAKQERVEAARRRKLAGSLDETLTPTGGNTQEENPFAPKPKIAMENSVGPGRDDF